MVPAINNGLQVPAFGQTIAFDLPLEQGYQIGVSTDQGTTYQVEAFNLDITGFI